MTYNLHIPQHLPAIVGINEAHILSQLRRFINLGKDDGITADDDGRLWLAKRYSAWAKIFNWISEDRIGRLFNKLKRLGYLDIRQCGSKNCFSLTKQGADLFDDYTANPETRRFTESTPETPSRHGKSPSQTRHSNVPDTVNHRPFSIYNINNLIKDSDKAIDSIQKDEELPYHSSMDESPNGSRATFKDWWFACQGQLELQLNRATYDTWVRDVKFASFTDGKLTLHTRNHYASDWLAGRLSPSIANIFAGMTRVEVNRVVFVAHNHDPVIVERATTGHYAPTPSTVNHAKLQLAQVS